MFYNPAQGIIRRIDHAEVEPSSIQAEGQPQVPSYATVQAKPHVYFDQSASRRSARPQVITLSMAAVARTLMLKISPSLKQYASTLRSR